MNETHLVQISSGGTSEQAGNNNLRKNNIQDKNNNYLAGARFGKADGTVREKNAPVRPRNLRIIAIAAALTFG